MSIYETGPVQGKIIEFGLESDLSNGLNLKGKEYNEIAKWMQILD